MAQILSSVLSLAKGRKPVFIMLSVLYVLMSFATHKYQLFSTQPEEQAPPVQICP